MKPSTPKSILPRDIWKADWGMPLADWPLFDIPVCAVLDYLDRRCGGSASLRSLHQRLFPSPARFPDWESIRKQGLHSRLHLNLGTPGIEEPDDPIEENAIALYTALLLGWDSLPVILSGELELAVEEGLIPSRAMELLKRRIKKELRANT